MGIRETAKRIAAAPAELASRQNREIAPPPTPEPFMAWEPIPAEEDPRRVEFQRALARSTYVTGPSVEQVAEAQRRDNAIAAAFMAQGR